MNNEKYTRIKNYLMHISDYDDYEAGATISSLAKAMNLPIEIVRNDIATMTFCSDDIYFDIDNDIDYNSEEDFDGDISYIKRPKVQRHHAIIKGSYDDIPVLTTLDNVKSTIVISKDEAFALSQLRNRDYELSNNKATKLGDFSKIKTLNDDNLFPKNSLEIIDELNEVIDYKQCLAIDYQDLKGELFHFILLPGKIAYDNLENAYYLLAFNVDSLLFPLRLDRIIRYSISNMSFTNIDTSILAIAPMVWGMSFRDEPQNVKVRFKNEANVFSKVKRDLSARTNGTLYEKDGYLFYEDTVYGIGNFKNWILRYGSSAIVEKPASLRKQIIESYKRRLEMYD